MTPEILRAQGSIEIIAGCMFSGKTDEMIRRLRLATIARKKVQVFKPIIDNRYAENKVVSHAKTDFPAIPIQSAKEIIEKIERDTNVVAIDEAQFFDEEVIGVVRSLSNSGLRVIIAGLDTNYKGEPFGQIPSLLAISDKLDKLKAICMVCGEPATRTQRIVNGRPAYDDEPVVVIGASELYEARCRLHHEVPHRPRDPK